ncbi:MAG: cytidylate kinase family protein [Chloroflexi bacterium]|nr:cytidylate kinase family protein [Chloroflexota bacterium]
MAIVTLSKETFSGASELAEQVSESLGYRLVSRDDIIEKTALYGMSTDRQQRARRRRLGILARMDLKWKHYLVFSRAALTKEIRQGGLVYLGGNGHALLNGFPNLLNVKVVSDMEYRIENLIKRTDYAIDRKMARRLIQKIDDKEARWRRTLHENGWHDSSGFDLVVQSGQVTIPEACDLIRDTLEQPQYQTTYKSLETIDLLTVAAELRARIAMKSDIADDNVDVQVRDGVIVITGSVRSTSDLDGIKELLD